MAVRVDLNISLDGYGTTTDGTADNPFGEDWGRLVGPYTQTRTFRERVLGMTDGSGTTHLDDEYAKGYFDGIGAEIMGAGKFGLHLYPDDPDWKGWWGDEPPFGFPVFVLTHTPRPSLAMKGGTEFHFITATPEEALAQATAVAGDRDVRVGGGITVVRDYLKADLVDRLHVAITPIILGQGLNLWEDLRGLERRLPNVTTETAPSGIVHITMSR
ncbi:MAG TPA: dihydrofolate reductase family protein [Thermomicrobiales bacterium]|jgi:dihydrofolate reductase|nr:dihydrofolate reductase family protein [Thermomicrobiales bacterium]